MNTAKKIIAYLKYNHFIILYEHCLKNNDQLKYNYFTT